MQENFIFFDTESNSKQINEKTKELTFKMGTAIFWKRKDDYKKELIFYDVSNFWNEIDDLFDEKHKQFIMFAHNVHFDMKMVNGFNELSKRNWKLINHYVRNKVYIMLFKKDDFVLHVWDTSNYFTMGFSVSDIGEMVGYPKLEVNFDKCTKQELEIYCMRDTYILYEFVKNMIIFLIKNDLSRLKATASSLSFNVFRYKFYDENNGKIWIHDFKRAIRLERNSYRGGITDLFRIGKHERVYKTDINSHYSKAMRDMKLPTKLLLHTHECDKTLIGLSNDDLSVEYLTSKQYRDISRKLMKIYDNFKKDYGIITNCTFYLPKKYAYILNDFGLGKTSFAYGRLKACLCTPELNFIEKYGKILKIHEINVYEIKYLFKDFVDFFYDLKAKYSEQDNKVFRNMTKLILNGQYGKWGQKEYISEQLNDESEYLIRNQDMLLDIIKEKMDLIKKSSFVYLGSINSKELYVIDKKLYLAYNTQNNSKESFVAISSFITSQARMNLVNYILIAERKNCYYTDTDSVFVNEKGYNKLLKNKCFDEYELGKLKLEGFGNAEFFNPKFYDFWDKDKDFELTRKCKGIKQKSIDGKKAKILSENRFHVKYQVEQWDKFKSDMKKGNFTNQFIRIAEKVMSKVYDKGKICKNGHIKPFHITEINNI